MRYKLSVFLFLIVVLSTCSKQVEENVVAEVNHEKLMLDDLDLIVSDFEALDSLQKAILVESWIRETLLAQEAEKNLLHRDPAFQYRIETYRRRLLADKQIDALLRSQGTIKQTDVESYYQKNLASFKRLGDEFYGFHAVLPTRKDALRLIRSIEKNDDAQKQEILGLNPREVGLFKLNDLLPKIKDYLLKKKKPGVYGPLKTDFGHHVIEVRTWFDQGSVKTVDEMWEEIAARLSINKQRHLESFFVDSLRRAGSVMVNTRFLSAQ